jgi:pilus assembly protein TadC
MVAVIVMQEERLRRELTQRQKELRADYPEFVEHFVLLIGAGLNVKGAWERIAGDYRQTKRQEKKQYVYEEMLISVYEMENGMSEARAYELFGKRTGLLQYMKFCTLIVQNLKKGSDDLLHILEYEVADAFRERKESAKALGEEAGTKLLLPMMLMLVIVFVLILYAAFYNM